MKTNSVLFLVLIMVLLAIAAGGTRSPTLSQVDIEGTVNASI